MTALEPRPRRNGTNVITTEKPRMTYLWGSHGMTLYHIRHDPASHRDFDRSLEPTDTVTILLWPPCVAVRTLYFRPVVFNSFSFFIFSLPILSRRRFDVYDTSTHGVALVRLKDAGLKCTVSGWLKYRTQKSREKSPSGHHRTNLSGYVLATGTYRQSEKTC